MGEWTRDIDADEQLLAANTLPLCPKYMADGIYHLDKNCDHSVFHDSEEFSPDTHWPNRRGGAEIAHIVNAFPAYIARVRELEAENTALQAELVALRTQVGVRRRGLEGRV